MLRIQLCAFKQTTACKETVLHSVVWCLNIAIYYDIYWDIADHGFALRISSCLYRRTDDMSVVTGKTLHALAQAHPNTSSTIILWGISMKLSAFQTLATPHHPTHSKSDRMPQNTITMAARMPVISWSSFAQCLGRPSVFQAHRPWWRKRRERRERKPRPKTPSRRLRQSWLQRHPPNCHPKASPKLAPKDPQDQDQKAESRGDGRCKTPKRRRKLRTKKALRKRTVALVFCNVSDIKEISDASQKALLSKNITTFPGGTILEPRVIGWNMTEPFRQSEPSTVGHYLSLSMYILL